MLHHDGRHRCNKKPDALYMCSVPKPLWMYAAMMSTSIGFPLLCFDSATTNQGLADATQRSADRHPVKYDAISAAVD